MKIIAKNIVKSYEFIGDAISKISFENTITNTTTVHKSGVEFMLNFKVGLLKKLITITNQDMLITSKTANTISFGYVSEKLNFSLTLQNNVVNGYISTTITDLKFNRDIFIDSIQFLPLEIDNKLYNWHCPYIAEKSFIEPHFMSLGQPIYRNDVFFGIESMVAENSICNSTAHMKYYIGRQFSSLGKGYIYPSYVIGGAENANYIACQNAFFEYVNTFARSANFRIQFNSWYDNMLDITPQNIASSFTAISEGFKKHGLNDIDCYVVDDGWVDYKNKELWAFNDKFPNEFNKECELTKNLNSTFGVWFGPRGGYSEAFQYAKRLKKNGYHVNKKGFEICTADNNYVSDLTDKMIEFIDKFNVTYFKIDGFAIAPCKNKHHGHPVGGANNMYFYTYQWECWFNAFDRIRQHKEDIFLNVTSHSNTSPWLLKYADAVWLNNSKDMDYIGQGTDLQQCLNYRDDRYFDFTTTRQLQFPLSHLYNHEPCYGNRNYNPPLPAKSHRTVVYSDQEFEQYLYMCMMRGSGFVELYYSPNMMSDNKHAINARILKWAKENYNVLQTVKFFGSTPKNTEVYGYIGYSNKKGLLSIRNPKNVPCKFSLDLKQYTPITTTPIINAIYGDTSTIEANSTTLTFNLAPQQVIVLEF